LDRIYLDTGAVYVHFSRAGEDELIGYSFGTGDMPDREPVLRDLVEQMSLYPPDTVFFLNVWCFGSASSYALLKRS
jgi:hypothetical protein